MKRAAIILMVFLLLYSVRAEIGIIGLETDHYNIGDSVTLKGFIQVIDKFSGNLEINSICENNTKPVYFSVISLGAEEREEFVKEFPIKENMLGTCYFKVDLKNDAGDLLESENSGEFIISKELRVDAETDVLTQQPGREVKVSGVIRKSNGLRVKGGSVVLSLGNKIYAGGLSEGAFSQTIGLPSDLSSGEQKILIEAKDLEGNDGSGEVKFRVISIPRGLSIELDKEIYRPGEKIIAKILLNDQTGNNVAGSATVQLYDANNNEYSSRVVENGDEFEIDLGDNTLPGTWVLEARSREFEMDKKFYVEEIRDKEVRMEGNKLIITNIGNVDYDEPIQIDLKDENGEEYKVIKRTSLRPNQTVTIDLTREVPGGNYDVNVGGNMITGNVVIEGASLGGMATSKFLGYIALGFVFLFLILVVVSKSRRKVGRREFAKSRGKEILANTLVRKEEKQSPFLKAKKEDVDFFLNKVKKETSPEKKGPFDIFN